MPSPEHDAVVELVRATRGDPDVERPIEESRADLDGLAELMPLDADITATPVDADGVPCEWIEAPGADRSRVVVHLHGGAYTAGSLTSHRSLCGRMSRACGVRVLSVGYRLAPEHPCPAAVDDAVTVYRWLLVDGMPAKRIVLSGDSAGGGLAMAALIALRDGNQPMPAGAVLMSPWVDLTLSGESMDARASEDPICARASLARSAASYATDADRAGPRASPLFADLSALPPLLILVGTAEVLLDDAVRLAAAATSAGVDVTLEVEADLLHVWPIFAGVPESEAALARVASWSSPLLA